MNMYIDGYIHIERDTDSFVVAQHSQMSTTHSKNTIVDEPRSKIYHSSRGSDALCKFETAAHDVQTSHILLVLTSGAHYTQDLISRCTGALRCYNCTQSIDNHVYFYPVEYTKHSEFVCSPLPHCRAACALRTVYDTVDNHNLLTVFVLMYGDSVYAAPPRQLLYVPGGMDTATYHTTIEQHTVMQIEPPNIRSFFAPIYVSSAIMEKYTLRVDSIEQVTRDTNEHRVFIGKGRESETPVHVMDEDATQDLL